MLNANVKGETQFHDILLYTSDTKHLHHVYEKENVVEGTQREKGHSESMESAFSAYTYVWFGIFLKLYPSCFNLIVTEMFLFIINI